MSLQEDVPDEDCQVEDYEGDTSAKNNQTAMAPKAKLIQQPSLLT